jgi:hypothetical protein
MKTLSKIIEWLLYAFIFLLPWQTRWIYKIVNFKDEYWEYQSQSLYATEILFLAILVLSIIYFSKKFNFKNFIKKHSQKKFFFFAVIAAAFIGIIIASQLQSQNTEFAFYKITHLIEAVALAATIIFFPYNFKKFSWAFIGAGLVQALLAIDQFFNQKIVANKWLGMASQDPQVLGTSVIESSGERFLRAYGSLPHPNILAGFLAIALLFVIYQYFNEDKKKKKNIALTVFIIIFTALLMTFSRSAWIAVCISIIFIFIMVGTKKNLWQKYKTSINKLIVAILFIAIAFSLVKTDLIFTRFQLEERLEVKSLTERASGYQDGWEIFKNNLAVGTGIGNYTLALSKLHPDWQVWQMQPVHNGLFLSIIEMGIILSLLIISFIIFILKYLIKLLKGKWFTLEIIFSSSIILSLFILCLFDHFLWSMYFGIMLVAFSALILRFSLRPSPTPRGN